MNNVSSDVDYKNSLEYQRKLLLKMDRFIYSFLKRKSVTYRDRDMKYVIRELIKIHEGSSKAFNNDIYEDPKFLCSRLLKEWHAKSMNLSL